RFGQGAGTQAVAPLGGPLWSAAQFAAAARVGNSELLVPDPLRALQFEPDKDAFSREESFAAGDRAPPGPAARNDLAWYMSPPRARQLKTEEAQMDLDFFTVT